MKFLNLYRWIIGTKASFCRSFQDNDNLYAQAETFWNNLEGSAFIFIMVFIVLGVAMTICYYKTFNDRPNRHYHPKYWIYFWIGTFALVLVVTLAAEYIAVEPKLDGSFILEFKIALANAIYASVLYLFVSWLWCQFNWPANAYRLIKF